MNSSMESVMVSQLKCHFLCFFFLYYFETLCTMCLFLLFIGNECSEYKILVKKVIDSEYKIINMHTEITLHRT